MRRVTPAPVRSPAIWFWREFWQLWRGLVGGVVGNGRRLGGERPSRSAKVVDVKCWRMVEVLGNHKRLGKNGRRRWHNTMEGERPFASKLSVNSHHPIRPSQSASAQVLTNLLWQEGQRQAGGPPNIPSSRRWRESSDGWRFSCDSFIGESRQRSLRWR